MNRLNIEPQSQNTNRGRQYYFRCQQKLSGSGKVYTRSGLVFTYRAAERNYVILPPTNGRTWGAWKNPRELPELPHEFLPYDRHDPDQVLNCLAWQIRTAYREGHFSGYTDLDAAFMALLVDCNIEEQQIQRAFEITFGADFDQRRTGLMYRRTLDKMRNGDPVIGAGSFMQRAKEEGLLEVERFARELQTVTRTALVTAEQDWPDPIPFDEYSSLPDFPVDALGSPGREMVEAVSEVNQVDPALPASVYLAAVSTACANKANIDLKTHKEPSNCYLCPVYDSGNRKSSTVSEMARPLYEFQQTRQEEMVSAILDAQNSYKIREKRLERQQKKAAEEKDPDKRRQFENEASKIARDLAENPVPRSPIFLVDDVTPEKMGILMAENRERMSIITPEGGLFEIMAGRYLKDGVGNFDLFLKAHAGDFWSNHRVGREAKTMQTPALTLCLAVQSGVIEEVGKNRHFRGRGLLARFLYARCKSRLGYRERQKTSIPPSLTQRYRNHLFSLLEIPFTLTNLKLSPEAQRTWDEFYNDIEKEMRPGGSLQYLADWGSKLPGAVARIAGLLHFAEYEAGAIDLPISVDSVSASCVIGAYFKEHAIAVFGLMQEDRRFKLARQILDYVDRIRPETFKGRDIMHHTSISVMEEVEQGLKVLLDRGYIREGGAEGSNRADNSGPGRPSAKTYRVNPKVFERKK